MSKGLQINRTPYSALLIPIRYTGDQTQHTARVYINYSIIQPWSINDTQTHVREREVVWWSEVNACMRDLSAACVCVCMIVQTYTYDYVGVCVCVCVPVSALFCTSQPACKSICTRCVYNMFVLNSMQMQSRWARASRASTLSHTKHSYQPHAVESESLSSSERANAQTQARTGL